MRRILTSVALVVLLLNPTAAVSADFQKGMDAAQRGDYTTALREWTPLAEQGHDSVQYNLCMMYAAGRGVPQDYVYAHMWGNIAVFIGGKDKGKVRDFVAKKMTPADISAAQKLARECVEKNYKGC